MPYIRRPYPRSTPRITPSDLQPLPSNLYYSQTPTISLNPKMSSGIEELQSRSQDHPDSYTAYAILERGGALTKITIPWKDPQAGEVVVKVIACGICGRSV